MEFLLGIVVWFPPLLAMIYLFFLMLFHTLIGTDELKIGLGRYLAAAAVLAAAFSIPAIAIAVASIDLNPTSTRRLAYASVLSPTLYVALGVVDSLLGIVIPDQLIWIILWTVLIVREFDAG